MDMIHLLMPDPSRVDDGAKAIGRACFTRELSGERQHFPECTLVALLGFVQRCDMRLRYDQDVDRRLRPDVMKGHDIVVLEDQLGRNLAARDFAKNAIRIRHPFLDAFSSTPEMPSRRCNSASTSAGPRPWRASTIMQWNQRSAVSRTRCSASPLFAASTVSVASSPIFLSMASSPFAKSCAT